MFFPTPPIKLNMELQNRWEITYCLPNTKPHGRPQSETGNTSQIIFITLTLRQVHDDSSLSLSFSSLSKGCTNARPKPYFAEPNWQCFDMPFLHPIFNVEGHMLSTAGDAAKVFSVILLLPCWDVYQNIVN